MKRIIVLLFSLLCLTVSPVYAFPDALWVNHASHDIVPGHKGAIIPMNRGNFDALALNAARSKSLTISWFSASDVDPAAAPEKIGKQLAGKADFFMLVDCKPMAEVHETFNAVRQSYTNREWKEICYKENQGAMPKSTRKWTEDEWSHTEYVDIPASSFDAAPLYVWQRIYDTTGRLIAVHGGRYDEASYDQSFSSGMENFFGGVLNNIVNNTNDADKETDVSANEWAAEGYNMHDKASIYMAPVTVSAAEIANIPTYAQAFEGAVMTEAAKKLPGVMVTHNEYAPLRMEVDVCSFDVSYQRVEPHYDLEEKQDTDYSDIQHDNDIFSDTMEVTKHWTECTTQRGTCDRNTNVAMAVKVYDRATNKLVYSYIGSAHPYWQMDGLYSILHDFYNRLGKKLH